MIARSLLAGGLVCSIAAVWATRSAEAEPAASRVIDRTVSCATQVRGGIRVLVAEAVTGIKESSSPLVWKQLPNANLNTGFGVPLASASAGVWTVPGGHTFSISDSLCRWSEARVALSTKGLTSEFVGSSGAQRRCLGPPRRVLVRARVTFRRPASLARVRVPWGTSWRTAVPVREAEIAVRTEAGKQLAYAYVRDDGRARLFAAPTCYPD